MNFLNLFLILSWGFGLRITFLIATARESYLRFRLRRDPGKLLYMFSGLFLKPRYNTTGPYRSLPALFTREVVVLSLLRQTPQPAL